MKIPKFKKVTGLGLLEMRVKTPVYLQMDEATGKGTSKQGSSNKGRQEAR